MGLNCVSDIEQMRTLIEQRMGWFLVPMIKWLKYRDVAQSYRDLAQSKAIIRPKVRTDNRAKDAFNVYAESVEDAINAVLAEIIETHHSRPEDFLEFKVSVRGLEIDEDIIRRIHVV